MTTIDEHIGNRIKVRREALQRTAFQLAADLGCPIGELEAHEAGTKRVDAQRLVQICRLLDVEVASFFDGYVRSTTDPAVERFVSNVIDLASRRRLRSCQE